MTVAGTFNPYECSTCQLNWYEERFYHANTRHDDPTRRVRPEEDEIENIPRVTRVTKPMGEVFHFENGKAPEKHYATIYQKNTKKNYIPKSARRSREAQRAKSPGYIWHHVDNESVTQRRMNTTAEGLKEILSAGSTRYLPDYSMPYRPPEKHYKTEYMKKYVRQL
jgi:hypothetical protein